MTHIRFSLTLLSAVSSLFSPALAQSQSSNSTSSHSFAQSSQLAELLEAAKSDDFIFLHTRRPLELLVQSDAHGLTALHYSAELGHDAFVKTLLDRRVPPDCQGGVNVRSALERAVSNGHTKVANLLLERGATLHPPNDSKVSHILAAAFNSSQTNSEILFCLQSHGARLTQLANNPIGEMPLSLAAATGALTSLRLMLSKKPDDDFFQKKCSKEHLNHALSSAVQFNQPEAAKLLIEAGAHPDNDITKDSISHKLLTYAAKKGYDRLVAVLLEKKASPLSRSSDGRSALSLAAESGYTRCVEALLAYNANVNSQDASGKTPLHYALVPKNEGCLTMLLEAGALIDTCDQSGMCPLCYALDQGKRYSVACMIKAHCERLLKNNKWDNEPTVRDVKKVLLKQVHELINQYSPPNTISQNQEAIERIYGPAIDEAITTFVKQRNAESEVSDESEEFTEEEETSNDDGSGRALRTEEMIAQDLESLIRKEYGDDSETDVIKDIEGRCDDLVRLLMDPEDDNLVNFFESGGVFTLLRMAVMNNCDALAQAIFSKLENGSYDQYCNSFPVEVVLSASDEIVHLLQRKKSKLFFPKSDDEQETETLKDFLERLVSKTPDWLRRSKPLIRLLRETLIEKYKSPTGLLSALVCANASYDLIKNSISILELPLTHQAGGKTTILHDSSLFYRPEYIRFFVEEGAFIDAQDETGQTPLHSAASRIRFSIDPREEEDGPLISEEKMLETLLACGANPNIRDAQAKTALDYLMIPLLDQMGSLDVVNRETCFAKDRSKRLSLIRNLLNNGAVLPHNFSMIDTLIVAGERLVLESFLKVTSPAVSDLIQPLHLAVLFDDPVSITILSEFGAHPDTALNDLRPLERAAQLGHVRSLSALCKAKANKSHKTDSVGTALFLAIEKRDDESVKVLLPYSAAIDEPDAKGRTPLSLAISLGDTSMADILLSAGSNVNAKNERTHLTPILEVLFHAPESKHSSLVNLLLKRGAPFDPELYIKNCFWKYMPSQDEFERSSKRIFEAIWVFKHLNLSPFVISWILLSDNSMRGTKDDVICIFLKQLSRHALSPSLPLITHEKDTNKDLHPLATLFKGIQATDSFGVIAYLRENVRTDLPEIRNLFSGNSARISAIDLAFSQVDVLLTAGIKERYKELETAGKLLAEKTSKTASVSHNSTVSTSATKKAKTTHKDDSE